MTKDYLHGYCHEYAAKLKTKNDALVIECIVIEKFTELVHAYCVDEKGNYIDCRGSFSDREEFLTEFNPSSRRFQLAETMQFDSVASFKEYLCDFFKDGVTEYDEEIDDYITVPFIFE